MRTVKIKVINRVNGDMTMEVETEAVVDDGQAEQAGAEAAKTIREFLDGYLNEMDRNNE